MLYEGLMTACTWKGMFPEQKKKTPVLNNSASEPNSLVIPSSMYANAVFPTTFRDHIKNEMYGKPCVFGREGHFNTKTLVNLHQTIKWFFYYQDSHWLLISWRATSFCWAFCSQMICEFYLAEFALYFILEVNICSNLSMFLIFVQYHPALHTVLYQMSCCPRRKTDAWQQQHTAWWYHVPNGSIELLLDTSKIKGKLFKDFSIQKSWLIPGYFMSGWDSQGNSLKR